jgi:hypothetical protein
MWIIVDLLWVFWINDFLVLFFPFFWLIVRGLVYGLFSGWVLVFPALYVGYLFRLCVCFSQAMFWVVNLGPF